MYFFGGGHRDYGGNEVYRYDFNTLSWARLTDPAPLTLLFNGAAGTTGYIPANGTPPAPHTYDGLTWNPATHTMWLTGTAVPFSINGMLGPSVYNGPWEFNPQTKTWTEHKVGGALGYGETAMIGDGASGQMLQLGWDHTRADIIAPNGTVTSVPIIGTLHDKFASSFGTLASDPATGKFYLSSEHGFFELGLVRNGSGQITALDSTQIPGAPSGDYRGYAYRPVDGKFYSWTGGDAVSVFDPATKSFDTIHVAGPAPAASDPGNGKVLEKWVYLPDADAFAGIASRGGGIWIYTPNDSTAGDPNRPDAQDDSASMLAGQAKVIDVLANDLIRVAGTLTVSNLNSGAHGTAVLNADGTVTYTPDAGFHGGDSFTYTVADGHGGHDSATVTVDVAAAGGTPGPRSDGPLADQTHVGTVGVDATTTQTISLSLPTTAGDRNDDGAVHVFYRETGSSDWHQGMDLYQGHLTTTEPYSGMLLGLKEGTQYDIKLVVDDGDGVQGSAEQLLTATTKSTPGMATEASATRVVHVGDFAALQAAVNGAVAGDLILLDPGTYDGNLVIHQRHGTEDAPITIRGAEGLASTIDAGGFTGVMISDSDYIDVEGLHIKNAEAGIQVRDWYTDDGTVGNTIRGNYISDVIKGIVAISNAGYGHKDLFISDNVLEGRDVFGDTSHATWTHEGIVVAGQGIEVQNNTLSGFGDALGLTHGAEQMPNRGDDFHNNLVRFSGDDSIELDFTDRNVAAHNNLFSNAADGISFQYVEHGPAYAYENVIYNVLNVYKVKPEADFNDGVFIYNNTAVNGGRAWTNASGAPKGFTMVNNLFTGDGKDPDVVHADTSYFSGSHIDYNAWTYDGHYQLGGDDGAFYTNFASWQSDPKHSHDVLLAGQKVFDDVPLDFDENGFLVYRDPLAVDFSLAAGSKAIDAGLAVPGLTDGFTGAAPDIGAVETGAAPVVYGARSGVTVPPPHSPPPAGNAAPEAHDDTASTIQDQAVTIHVLANDSDADGDVLQLGPLGAAQHGTVSVAGTDVVYAPAADFFGDDAFTYAVSDGRGHSDSATVAVHVAAAPGTTDPGSGTTDPGPGTGSGPGDHIDLSDLTLGFTVDGHAGDDTIVGSQGDDRVSGGAGVDTMDGAGGNDVLRGDDGADTIRGGAGRDGIDGGAGDDLLDGGAGGDVLSGGDGADRMLGGAGDDHLMGNGGADVLDGGDGNDIVDGGAGGDVLLGGAGNDTLIAGAGDTVTGGDGADRIVVPGMPDLRGATVEIKDFDPGHDALVFKDWLDPLRPDPARFDFAHATVTVEAASASGGGGDLVMHLDDGKGGGLSVQFDGGLQDVSAALGLDAAAVQGGTAPPGALAQLASTHDWLIA